MFPIDKTRWGEERMRKSYLEDCLEGGGGEGGGGGGGEDEEGRRRG